MQIDAHQHFWRYDPAEYGWIGDTMSALRRDCMPAELKREMDGAGFEGCVAVQARQTLDETRWLLSLADAHPFILGVVGWIDLQAPDIDAQIASFGAHPKLVGIRHIVQGERDDRFLLRPAFCQGIARLAAAGLAYDILVYPRHLPVAAEFVQRFSEQRFVLDHLGKPDIRSGDLREWRRDLGRLAANPQVFCKLSGLVTEADWRHWTPEQLRPCLDVAFECFGAERLMIGSDWPVCTVAADYRRTMGVIIEYLDRFREPARAAVLGGSARRFWNLPQLERAS